MTVNTMMVTGPKHQATQNIQHCSGTLRITEKGKRRHDPKQQDVQSSSGHPSIPARGSINVWDPKILSFFRLQLYFLAAAAAAAAAASAAPPPAHVMYAAQPSQAVCLSVCLCACRSVCLSVLSSTCLLPPTRFSKPAGKALQTFPADPAEPVRFKTATSKPPSRSPPPK